MGDPLGPYDKSLMAPPSGIVGLPPQLYIKMLYVVWISGAGSPS